MNAPTSTAFEPTEADLLRYCRIKDPAEFGPTAAERTVITLSYLSGRAFLASTDLRDVERDLEAGLSIRKRSGERSDYFVLSGARYEVYADAVTGVDGRLAADVTNVKPARRMERRDRVRPARVHFTLTRTSAQCDLESLVDEVAASLKLARRRSRLRDELLWRMRHPDAGPVQPSEGLREEVQRYYQPLQMLFELIRERSKFADQVSADGRVVGRRSDELYVRMEGMPAEFAERRARLRHDGRELATVVQSVEELDGDLVLCLEPPRNAALIPDGSPVTVSQSGRFSMNRHSRALQLMLDDEVEGHWENLALLLCRPRDLPAYPVAEPARYFADNGTHSLNAEQRAAVAGALSTPHGYLVQGPPGTGKSTVIEELVLQFIARNDRVLVLAPMHVAVDEVLGRIGDRPGVLALRMAIDQGNVHPDNLRFLPDNVAQTCLSQAKTADRAQASEWQAQAASLSATAARLDEYAAATENLAGLAANRATIATAYERQWRMLDAEHAAATADVARSGQHLLVIDEELRRVNATHRPLAERIAAVPGWRLLLSRVRVLFGVSPDEISELVVQVNQLARHRGELTANLQSWTASRQTSMAREQQLAEKLAATSMAHVPKLAEADRGVALAQRRLAEAAVALDAHGVRPSSHGATEWRRQAVAARSHAERLRRRCDLEKRWFELCGTGGASGLVDDEKLRSELMQAVNVVFGTTVGAFGKEIDGADFDTLIVDEASRVVDSEFLIGAVRARRWILVGDQRQLPPFVDQTEEHHLHALTAGRLATRQGTTPEAAIARLAELWHEEPQLHTFRNKSVEASLSRLRQEQHWEQYQRTFARHLAASTLGAEPERGILAAMRDHLVRSLFERCIAAEPTAITTALRWQHRSIDPIASLVREPVYGGRYETAPNLDQQPVTAPAYGAPVVFIDTSNHGDRARDEPVGLGFRNRFEAGRVRDVCRELNRAVEASPSGANLTVSILTFYLHQVRELRALVRPADYPALTIKMIDVIDRIQGQQSDIVIISFCRTYLSRARPRAHYAAWLQDIRRLNVAVTRARRGLYLVGHGDTLRKINGVAEAEQFYRNLFEQFRTNPDMVRVSDT